jgi:hypothetical protein
VGAVIRYTSNSPQNVEGGVQEVDGKGNDKANEAKDQRKYAGHRSFPFNLLTSIWTVHCVSFQSSFESALVLLGSANIAG